MTTEPVFGRNECGLTVAVSDQAEARSAL